jgi:hypothetical protein
VSCEFKPSGDTDLFKVTVPAYSVLSINVVGPTTTYWVIYSPEGEPINPNGCGGRCDVILNESGTYNLFLGNNFNSVGFYNLSLLGVAATSGFRCGPRVFPGGMPKTGKISPSGDTDSFRLDNVNTREIYSINVAGDYYTYWIIYDQDGNPINPERCHGNCNVELPSSGDYTVIVGHALNGEQDYTISVQKIGG